MGRWLLLALASAAVLANLVGGLAWAADAPPGASSCTGCHATRKVADSVIPQITGRSSADIANAMRQYRSGAWPSSVMGRIAKGFSDSEIDAIATWFAAQKD
jgi:sulfide dehydrogenase cytochrome subunit